MRRPPLAAAIAAAVLAAGVVPALAARVAEPPRGARAPGAVGRATAGLDRLAAAPAAGRVVGIATFGGRRPSRDRLAALGRLGLTHQALEHLPLAIVAGTLDQLRAAVEAGAAADVYPDDRLEYFWEPANAAMGVLPARAAGLTGAGVRVAVVDSGIDATHPDLADHVVHNVKLVGPEYANLPPDAGPGTLVVATEGGPYDNTDVGSGHGTHVAGIIAADGRTSPEQVGVAPDAELVGYAVGEVLFTTAVISAFDHILDHPEWGIDVVNNSWGSQWLPHDPAHPINVATRAVAERGIVVVFAAGNSGSDNTPMTLNPFSTPPWVLSVAAGSVSGERAEFSSGGLVHDNALPVPAGPGGHWRFEGDRIGLYHPDVTAPGLDIVSSGTPAVLVGPALPGGTSSASGTSMASPHAAGAAAVLLQANPRLTPAQVREALQATARPVAGGTPFWQAGYGYLDVGAAAALVRRPDWPRALAAAQAAADRRVLAGRQWRVPVSEHWAWEAPAATAAGVPDTRTVRLAVAPGTGAVAVSIAYPSAATLGANNAEYVVRLRDASGRVVAETRPSPSAGASVAFADLRPRPGQPAVAFGAWTAEVAGVLSASDPDTLDNESLLGRMVHLSVALLAPQAPPASPVPAPAPAFRPTGALTMLFQPDGATPLVSPEGCQVEAGAPEGGLAPAPAGGPCHSGATGWAVSRSADVPAAYVSAPLPAPLTVGGHALVVVHLADAAAPLASAAGVAPSLAYALDALDDRGQVVRAVAAGTAPVAGAGRSEIRVAVPPTGVPAGARLRLTLRLTADPAGAPTSAARLLYGGAYGDAGLALTTGVLVGPAR